MISGNVSLYNETKGQAAYPTAVVGMVGLIEDIDKRCTMGFKKEGDIVLLMGAEVQDENGLGGSEYLELIQGKVAGSPAIDLEVENRVQRCCLDAIRQGIIESAHDCSDGGLAIALAECCIGGNIGFRGELDIAGRLDAALFAEGQSRIIVTVAPDRLHRLERVAAEHEVPLRRLGMVDGRRFIIEGLVDLSLQEMAKAWRGGLEEALRF